MENNRNVFAARYAGGSYLATNKSTEKLCFSVLYAKIPHTLVEISGIEPLTS